MALATSPRGLGLDAVLCAPIPSLSLSRGPGAMSMSTRGRDAAADAAVDAGPAPALATPGDSNTPNASSASNAAITPGSPLAPGAAAAAAVGPSFPWSGRRWEDYFAGTIVGGGLLMAFAQAQTSILPARVNRANLLPAELEAEARALGRRSRYTAAAGAFALLFTYGVYDHLKLDPVEQISKKAER